MTNTPKPKRRFRFTLRALLVTVLVLAVPLGWFAKEMRRARRQKVAVTAMAGIENVIVYDYENEHENLGGEHPFPTWMKNTFGSDFLCQVEVVDLSDASDDDLVHVASLNELQELSLNGYFTDVGLVHLKGLQNLRSLSVCSEHITDAGLEHLIGLTSLRELYVRNHIVSDDGVAKLQKALPNCRIILPFKVHFWKDVQ